MAGRYVWDVVRRWLWLVGLGAVVAGGVSYYYSLTLPPTYRASTTLLINQAATPGVSDYNAILGSERLAKTYGQLLRSRPVLDDVIASLALPLSVEALEKQLSVSPVRETQLLVLSAEDGNAENAAALANETARVFIAHNQERALGAMGQSRELLQAQIDEVEKGLAVTQQALATARTADPAGTSPEVTRLEAKLSADQTTYATLLKSSEELRVSEAKVGGTVAVAEPALAPSAPAAPRPLRNGILGGALGLLVAVGVLVAVAYCDDRLHTPERAREVLGLETLAVVDRFSSKAGPLVRFDRKDKGTVNGYDRSPVSEAYRLLRTNVAFCQVDRPPKLLVVTSAVPGEGKSTTAANLAVVLAQAGKRVILVDVDLRRPSVHRVLGLENGRGLTHLLLQETPRFNDVAVAGMRGLWVVTSGPLPPNPSELLGSERMEQLLRMMASQADIVLLDAPPILPFADTVVLAPKVDGVLLVTDAEGTRGRMVRQAHERLQAMGAHVLGVVLNKARRHKSHGYHYYQYYASRKNEKASGPEMAPVQRVDALSEEIA